MCPFTLGSDCMCPFWMQEVIQSLPYTTALSDVKHLFLERPSFNLSPSIQGLSPGATHHGIFQIVETAVTLLFLLQANYPQALRCNWRHFWSPHQKHSCRGYKNKPSAWPWKFYPFCLVRHTDMCTQIIVVESRMDQWEVKTRSRTGL